jgi:hypothetical protein
VGTGIDLTHALPDEILDPVWTCVPEGGASCGSSGIGAIVDDALSLPNGGSVTYTLEGVVAASATGTLNHSFSAFPPSSHSEGDDTDNTAQDTTQVGALVNLVVALDAEPATALPGDAFTLVARVENRGPSGVGTGIDLTHALPDEILDPVWTCVPEGGASCGSSGVGAIVDDALSLPSGGSVTYTLEGVVAASATGTLNHSFSAFPPSSHSEDDDTDNTAQDTTQVSSVLVPHTVPALGALGMVMLGLAAGLVALRRFHAGT